MSKGLFASTEYEEKTREFAFSEYQRKEGEGEESFVKDENGNRIVETQTDKVFLPGHEANTIGAINNVFGGGNAAEVDGNTNVNIGTLSSQVFVTPKTKTVTGSTTEVETTDAERTKTVEGVDIRGNVYGGGNQAKVTGNTNVVIGKSAE